MKKEKEALLWLGELTIIHADGEETNGHYCMMELYATKEGNPPWHVHENEDESFYILEGEITFGVGDKTIKAKKGDYLFAPKKIPHTYDVTSGKARVVITCSPAGFEKAVREMSKPSPTLEPPEEVKSEPGEEEMMQKVAAKYKVYFVDPPEGAKVNVE